MRMRTEQRDRITDIDALRGCALFGIVVVNSTVFASAYYGSGVSDPAFSAPFDQGIRFLISFLFETKFYLLFSFLFGYSLTLQMRSAERAGEALMPRMIRRQVGLWIIGIAHAVLLFYGDILTTYAVLGLVLLALRRLPERRALKLAAWLIVATALAWGLLGLLLILGGGIDKAGILSGIRRTLVDYQGSTATVIGRNLRQLPTAWVAIGFLQAPCALAMFLIGFVAGKRRMVEHIAEYRPMLKHILIWGATLGASGAALYAYASVFLTSTGWEVAVLMPGLLSAPLLAGAYAVAILLAFQTTAGARVAEALAPAGRMALSNYLLQSLACALIFTAYGLGRVGQLAPSRVLSTAIAIFLVQLVCSAWWLRRFCYGPVEWLLRALTIGAWPQWRR